MTDINAHSVLVVDDSFANLKLVCLLLEGEGYTIRTAMCAEDAIATLEEFVPDMILMDIQLPGKDGLTLTREIKQDPRYKDIVIVALTAYAMKGDDERARESGCAGYITKPIDTRSFGQTMAQYLADR